MDRWRGRALEVDPQSNANPDWSAPFLVAPPAPAAAVRAAWAPVMLGQPVPVLGEEVPCDDIPA